VLESVARLRGAAHEAAQAASTGPVSPATVRQVAAAENQLNLGLARFMAVAEAYPDLKGDRSVRQLMEDLVSAENRIAFARQAYNDSAMRLNTAVQSFPANLVARPFGFTPAAFFEADDAARGPVSVSLASGA